MRGNYWSTKIGSVAQQMSFVAEQFCKDCPTHVLVARASRIGEVLGKMQDVSPVIEKNLEDFVFAAQNIRATSSVKRAYVDHFVFVKKEGKYDPDGVKLEADKRTAIWLADKYMVASKILAEIEDEFVENDLLTLTEAPVTGESPLAPSPDPTAPVKGSKFGNFLKDLFNKIIT